MQLLRPFSDYDRSLFKSDAFEIGFGRYSANKFLTVMQDNDIECYTTMAKDRIAALQHGWRKVLNYLEGTAAVHAVHQRKNVNTVIMWLSRFSLDLWFSHEWATIALDNQKVLLELMERIYAMAKEQMPIFDWSYLFTLKLQPWNLAYLKEKMRMGLILRAAEELQRKRIPYSAAATAGSATPVPMTPFIGFDNVVPNQIFHPLLEEYEEPVNNDDIEYLRREGIFLCLVRLVKFFDMGYACSVKVLAMRVIAAWNYMYAKSLSERSKNNQGELSQPLVTVEDEKCLIYVCHTYLMAVYETDDETGLAIDLMMINIREYFLDFSETSVIDLKNNEKRTPAELIVILCKLLNRSYTDFIEMFLCYMPETRFVNEFGCVCQAYFTYLIGNKLLEINTSELEEFNRKQMQFKYLLEKYIDERERWELIAECVANSKPVSCLSSKSPDASNSGTSRSKRRHTTIKKNTNTVKGRIKGNRRILVDKIFKQYNAAMAGEKSSFSTEMLASSSNNTSQVDDAVATSSENNSNNIAFDEDDEDNDNTEWIFETIPNSPMLYYTNEQLFKRTHIKWFGAKVIVLLKIIGIELNNLEMYRYKTGVATDYMLTLEANIANYYEQLAEVFKLNDMVERECWLTAFSLIPCREYYEKVLRCGSHNKAKCLSKLHEKQVSNTNDNDKMDINKPPPQTTPLPAPPTPSSESIMTNPSDAWEMASNMSQSTTYSTTTGTKPSLSVTTISPTATAGTVAISDDLLNIKFQLLSSTVGDEDTVSFDEYIEDCADYQLLVDQIGKMALSSKATCDLISVLFSPRYKRLSWSLDWKILRKRCRFIFNNVDKKRNLIEMSMAEANSRLQNLDIDYDKYADKPQLGATCNSSLAVAGSTKRKRKVMSKNKSKKRMTTRGKPIIVKQRRRRFRKKHVFVEEDEVLEQEQEEDNNGGPVNDDNDGGNDHAFSMGTIDLQEKLKSSAEDEMLSVGILQNATEGFQTFVNIWQQQGGQKASATVAEAAAQEQHQHSKAEMPIETLSSAQPTLLLPLSPMLDEETAVSSSSLSSVPRGFFGIFTNDEDNDDDNTTSAPSPYELFISQDGTKDSIAKNISLKCEIASKTQQQPLLPSIYDIPNAEKVTVRRKRSLNDTMSVGHVPRTPSPTLERSKTPNKCSFNALEDLIFMVPTTKKISDDSDDDDGNGNHNETSLSSLMNYDEDRNHRRHCIVVKFQNDPQSKLALYLQEASKKIYKSYPKLHTDKEYAFKITTMLDLEKLANLEKLAKLTKPVPNITTTQFQMDTVALETKILRFTQNKSPPVADATLNGDASADLCPIERFTPPPASPPPPPIATIVAVKCSNEEAELYDPKDGSTVLVVEFPNGQVSVYRLDKTVTEFGTTTINPILISTTRTDAQSSTGAAGAATTTTGEMTKQAMPSTTAEGGDKETRSSADIDSDRDLEGREDTDFLEFSDLRGETETEANIAVSNDSISETSPSTLLNNFDEGDQHNETLISPSNDPYMCFGMDMGTAPRTSRSYQRYAVEENSQTEEASNEDDSTNDDDDDNDDDAYNDDDDNDDATEDDGDNDNDDDATSDNDNDGGNDNDDDATDDDDGDNGNNDGGNDGYNDNDDGDNDGDNDDDDATADDDGAADNDPKSPIHTTISSPLPLWTTTAKILTAAASTLEPEPPTSASLLALTSSPDQTDQQQEQHRTVDWLTVGMHTISSNKNQATRTYGLLSGTASTGTTKALIPQPKLQPPQPIKESSITDELLRVRYGCNRRDVQIILPKHVI